MSKVWIIDLLSALHVKKNLYSVKERKLLSTNFLIYVCGQGPVICQITLSKVCQLMYPLLIYHFTQLKQMRPILPLRCVIVVKPIMNNVTRCFLHFMANESDKGVDNSTYQKKKKPSMSG